MSFIKALLSGSGLLLLISSTITILLSLRMYPGIIYINKCKGLMDVPDNPKIQYQNIPVHGSDSHSIVVIDVRSQFAKIQEMRHLLKDRRFLVRSTRRSK